MLYFCLFIYHWKHFIYVYMFFIDYNAQILYYKMLYIYIYRWPLLNLTILFCLILDNLFLKELFKHWKHVETIYIDLKFSMQLRTYSLCNILVSGGQNCLHSMLRDTFMSGSYLIDPISLRTWLIDFWQVLLVYW